MLLPLGRARFQLPRGIINLTQKKKLKNMLPPLGRARFQLPRGVINLTNIEGNQRGFYCLGGLLIIKMGG